MRGKFVFLLLLVGICQTGVAEDRHLKAELYFQGEKIEFDLVKNQNEFYLLRGDSKYSLSKMNFDYMVDLVSGRGVSINKPCGGNYLRQLDIASSHPLCSSASKAQGDRIKALSHAIHWTLLGK